MSAPSDYLFYLTITVAEPLTPGQSMYLQGVAWMSHGTAPAEQHNEFIFFGDEDSIKQLMWTLALRSPLHTVGLTIVSYDVYMETV